MKKRLAALVLAAVMAISFTVTAFAGTWQIYDDNWYFYDSPEDDSEEELLTGWQWIDGYCYYLDPDEDGAMAVSTVTPDGFSVNEIGRMLDMYGEPYYIPGWGFTSTTLGPGEYEPGSGVIYGEPSDYYLSQIFDLETLYDILNGRDRDRDRHEEPRRKDPDTVVIVVGGQSGKPEGEPDKAGELPEKPEEKPEELPVKPEELPKAEEQSDTPVIRAGGSTSHSETANDQAEKKQIGKEQPEKPAGKQEGSSGESAQSAGRTQGRPASGNTSRSRGGLNELDPDLLALLGLE